MFWSAPSPANDSRQEKNSLSWRRRLLFSIIMLLVTVVAIEMGLKVLYSLKDKDHITPRKKAARIAAYSYLDWPQKMFAEEDRL